MPNEASPFYSGESGREYHFQKRGVPPECVPWIARLRAEKFAPWIGPEKEVIEIGAGAGWNLASLKCRRKIAVEPSEFLADELKAQGIEHQVGTKALGDSSADVILCHHALEHVRDPLAMLTEMRRLLRVDGRLVLHIPLEHERRYRKFDPSEPNHHLFSWNVQTLGNLLVEAKFNLIQIGTRHYGYDRAAATWGRKLGMGERGFRWLRRGAVALIPLTEIEAVCGKAS